MSSECVFRKTGVGLEAAGVALPSSGSNVIGYFRKVLGGGNSMFKSETFPRFGGEELNEFLDEANKFLERGERTSIAQACEKFYKVTEEIIKILAEEHSLEEWRKAEKEGRWTAKLLHTIVPKLTGIESELIRDAWSNAWYLHTSGFHEKLLGAEEVHDYVDNIRNLVEWFNRRNIYHSRTSGTSFLR